MFNLGFRQVVINDGVDPVIKEVSISIGGVSSDYIEIEGFGKFKVNGSGPNNYFKDPVERILGETIVTTPPLGWTIDQIWEIKVHVSAGEGDGGSTGELRDSGEILYFQVGKIKKLGTTNPPTDFEGILAQNVKDSSNALEYTKNAAAPVPPDTATGTFTFKPGYEGYTIDKVYATKIYDPTIPGFDDRYAMPEDITGAITEGNFGFGYPAQIEESIRNNTPATVSPYSIHVGGNYAVAFDNDSAGTLGKIRYTEVTWFTDKDHLEGVEPHDMLGYGDANTETLYADRKYSVYIQSTGADGTAKNGAEITLLKSI